jgi:hypothetical protein
MLCCATLRPAISFVVVVVHRAAMASSFRAVRGRHLAHLTAARDERDLRDTP